MLSVSLGLRAPDPSVDSDTGVHDVTAPFTAEQAIADAEGRYRLLADNVTDAVFLVDITGSFLWVSPSVTSMLGYQPQDLIGVGTADLVHPEDLPIHGSVMAKVKYGQKAAHWEFRARTAADDFRWMSAVSSPAVDTDGAIVGWITTLRDNHEQVLNRQSLARNEQTLRLAMQGAPQGVATVGLHGRLLQVNPAFLDLTGYDQKWMQESTEFDLLHPDDVEADQAVRDRLLSGAAEYDIHEGRVVTATGEVLRVQHSLALIRDEHNMPLFYVSQYQDVTAAKAARADVTCNCELGGNADVLSRDRLQARIADVLAQERRQPGVLGVLYCDLDNFKAINAAYGRAAGDHVLCEIANRICSAIGDAGEVVKLGGDEFVVLLTDAVDAVAAVEVAQKIRAAVAQPLPVGHGRITMAMSVGVAVADDDVEARRLLRNADSALYEAKNHGRDRIVSFG